ncbi:tyrosine-type recombinase/integrase [Pseudoroseomonas cervicalis]|uniref:tyrosine-type recombinase/integrase n=1 Tax=Teichococcus cervicalis TaxID=204525 RepID=UPI002785FFF6|nr:tyrosine-type recombinase/integrase [Pseudoroseomonas cervicalis]MDQ1079726.1 integrase [Pseudoroseomonas cervicalis]
MTLIRLRYVQRFVDRYGKARYYVRRPGTKRAALPGQPGSPEFMAAYQAAMAAAPDKAPIGATLTVPGSIDALAVDWYGSALFRQLASSTQAVYRRNLERIRAAHGHRLVADLDAQVVRRLMAKQIETPAAANHVLRMLRLLMRHAIDLEWRPDDPTRGVRRFRERQEGARTWSEEDIARFEAHHPIGSRARLAMALLLYTGQRRSDVVKMGRQHLRGGSIFVRQQKTGAELLIPLHPELRRVLEATQGEHLTFLTTQAGASFASPTGFYNWFVEVTQAAGLPKGLSPHGLRKAAARRLAEAGCSAHQIAAITGHKTLSEVERYTRAVDQERLATAAILKLGGAGS